MTCVGGALLLILFIALLVVFPKFAGRSKDHIEYSIDEVDHRLLWRWDKDSKK
jgi:hypothetical protein